MKGKKAKLSNHQGITLIALVITIIIMLILAGISLNATIGDNGIISKAREAKFKQALSSYKEQADAYALEYNMDNDIGIGEESTLYSGALREAGKENDTIGIYNDIYTKHFKDLKKLSEGSSTGTISNTSIDEVIPDMENYYKKHIGIEIGTMMWFAEKRDDVEVQWALDLGISVFIEGVGKVLPDGSYQIYSKGEYTNSMGTSGTYCSEPDLTGFNTATTYYIEYESDNQSSNSGNPIYLNVPDNWYDYGNQRWANIATVNDCQMTYWTWIPRYVYKVDQSGDTIDCKFVNTSNVCIDTNGLEVDVSDYILPSAFTFDGKELSGIWVSKYEISEPVHPTGFSATTDKDSIIIQSITTIGSSTPGGDNPIGKNVNIHISGNGIDKTISSVNLPYKIEGLSPDKTYKVEVETPTFYETKMTLSRELTTPEGTVNEIANPDFTGFNTDTTYFVEYEEDNKTAKLSDKVQTTVDTIDTSKLVASNAPANWYDYTKKRWANVATMTSDGKIAYWTWVPRYKYKVIESDDTVDCIFVTRNKTNSFLSSITDKYVIPSAFTWNGKELSGMWVLKYEVTLAKEPTSFVVQAGTNEIKITSVSYTGSGGNLPTDGYILNVTDKASNSKIINNATISIGANGYNITGLSAGHTYDIELTAPMVYKDATGSTQYKKLNRIVSTVGSGDGTANVPNLDGFSKENTYYVVYSSNKQKALLGDKVEYDANGNPTNAPADWYDYGAKSWANIVTITVNEGKTLNLTKGMEISSINTTYSKMSMFVWVPRYEYKVDKNSDSTDIVFISSSKKTADSGYTIPSAFTWDGKELSGYWVSKYEVAEINNDN